MARRQVIYNDDSEGVHEARPGSARADLEAWVDLPLTRIPVDTYAWCTAFPDIVMHNSKVGEVYGRRFETPPNQPAAVIAELHAQGTDVLEVVAARARQHDVEIVASVRMSDTHHRQPDPQNPSAPQFLIDHPEYVIKRQDGVSETALDYSFPEVRAHRLAILRELAENYDIDGLELDFVRWGKHFAREEAPFKIGIMTEFVGQVRQVLDEAARQRGCDRMILGAQVLRSLYLNHLCGLDPRTWVEKGWLDYIIQCDFNCTDPQIPVAEFAEFCKDSPCTHHVRMGNMVGGRWGAKPFITGRKVVYHRKRSYGGMILTPAEARGAAANAYGFGADGIGLWNLCCDTGLRHYQKTGKPDMAHEQFVKNMHEWANEVASPDRVRAGRRVYHYLPIYKGEKVMDRNYPVNELRTGPAGQPAQIVKFPPKSLGFRQVFRFLMADGRDGGKLNGTLRLRMLQSTLEDRFALDINGKPINPAYVRRADEPDDELPAVWYEVGLSHCPPFAGQNELGITPLEVNLHPALDGDAAFLYEPYPYMEELIVTVNP